MKDVKEFFEFNNKQLEEVNGGISHEDIEKIIVIRDAVSREENARTRYADIVAMDVAMAIKFAEKEGIESELR